MVAGSASGDLLSAEALHGTAATVAGKDLEAMSTFFVEQLRLKVSVDASCLHRVVATVAVTHSLRMRTRAYSHSRLIGGVRIFTDLHSFVSRRPPQSVSPSHTRNKRTIQQPLGHGTTCACSPVHPSANSHTHSTHFFRTR